MNERGQDGAVFSRRHISFDPVIFTKTGLTFFCWVFYLEFIFCSSLDGTIIEMAKYTQLGLHEIRSLAQRYKLEITDYSVIEGGAANSSFFLNANGNEYVLTIADDKSVENVNILVGLLDYLAENGFPTSRVVVSGEGEKITLFRGKAVIVKEYIPGVTKRKISKDGLFSLGSILARLHQIPAPDFIPQTHSYGVELFPNAVGLNFDAEFEDSLTQMGDHFKSEIPRGLPRGLIHADVFWDNVIYLNGGFQALIDFEDACNYFKVYDLASALFGSCVKGGKLNLDKASQIIKGYEQVRVLEADERRALQISTVYAGVAISFWRYMKYNLYNPTEENKNLHKKTAEIADRIHAIPADIFGQVFI
jgi:homoserine kinase type II